jgi:diguanylate cyclase (GGDEF)-like protein
MTASRLPAEDGDRDRKVVPLRRGSAGRERPGEWLRYDQEAGQDPFTSLAGHPWFEEDLKGAARRRRAEENPWVAVAAVEGLALIDERLGPSVADAALKAISVRLRDSLRTGDRIARIGRDRFGLLVDAPYADEALTALERIAHSARDLVAVNPRWDGLRLWIGLAPLWSDDPEAALRQAGEALERARERGGTAVVMATAPRPAPPE